jgi:hypothetical protein
MRGLLFTLGLGLSLGAAAEEATAPRGIVQQRLPDGSILITDRPQAEGRTLRSWNFEPEDPAASRAAEARRAAARAEAEAVNERIARQMEQQRTRDLELELARTRATESRRPYEDEDRYAVAPYWIGWGPWPGGVVGRPHPPFAKPPGARPPVARPPFHKPPPRPGPVRPPRPGATPPPGPNSIPEMPF